MIRNTLPLLAAGLLFGTSAQATNIISNGSFETLNPEVTSAVDWFQTTNPVSPASTATGGSLGAFDGERRSFDSLETIFQLTSVAPTAGDSVVLDFYGNAAGTNTRSWNGKVTLDGGAGTRVELGQIVLVMDTNTGTWQQANAAGTAFSVDATQIATAGAGATYGVEFFSVTGDFVGIDLVSLDVVPEPTSLALLGLGGLLLARRRRD